MHNINIPYTLDLCLRRQNSAWIAVNPLSDRLSCHYRGHPAFDTTEMMMNPGGTQPPHHIQQSTSYKADIVQSSKHSTLDTDESGTGSSVASPPSSFWPDKPCRLNGQTVVSGDPGHSSDQHTHTRTHTDGMDDSGRMVDGWSIILPWKEQAGG